ncbi:type II toxin-antitoxin system Phd/YefM family antitoxin [uncultured Senegalimassilia sp.]|uniref:type II toxin-antitoxin system Phd/YefM family antitoxin n=1 Tax=uncultured Senegalimassilia sp. TaxID=1714350 RepID=UPI0025D7691C|nr:type II toxin-antitoxin system Phd/YefM family antitoxin [uncultured Senegalimassilia sp.]
MAALTIDLAEVEADFSRVAAEVNRTGKPVIVLKNNEPWVIIQPAKAEASAVDVAADFMDEYADVFEELAK